jgi:hypothetical protein
VCAGCEWRASILMQGGVLPGAFRFTGRKRAQLKTAIAGSPKVRAGSKGLRLLALVAGAAHIFPKTLRCSIITV